MILIPVKNLSTAKQRLASVLDQTLRTELAQAMLFDVLDELASWKKCPAVGLVTNDPFALELAARFGFEVIPDNRNSGETDAIAVATRHCESRGIESTLVIPGRHSLNSSGGTGAGSRSSSATRLGAGSGL